MDLNSEKLEIIKKIVKTDDVLILNQIKALFETKNKANWDELTPEQQDEINTSIQNENR